MAFESIEQLRAERDAIEVRLRAAENRKEHLALLDAFNVLYVINLNPDKFNLSPAFRRQVSSAFEAVRLHVHITGQGIY